MSSGLAGEIRREIAGARSGAAGPRRQAARGEPHVGHFGTAASAWCCSAVFGTAALLLASIGLYGVVSFTVAERTREIAIRVAIGARPSQVSAIFFKRGLRLTLIGGARRTDRGVAAVDGPAFAAVPDRRARAPALRVRGTRACQAWRSRPATCRPGAPRASILWRRSAANSCSGYLRSSTPAARRSVANSRAVRSR